MGMKPLEGQTYIPDKSFLRPDLIVTDVVYAPRETALLKMAKEVGCKTMNGLGMMLFQGSAAFELWTGEPMPIEYMKEILDIKYELKEKRSAEEKTMNKKYLPSALILYLNYFIHGIGCSILSQQVVKEMLADQWGMNDAMK